MGIVGNGFESTFDPDPESYRSKSPFYANKTANKTATGTRNNYKVKNKLPPTFEKP